VETSIGHIAVKALQISSDKLPVIFPHGVYLDHQMWDYRVSRTHDRTTISVDLPLHGMSRGGIRKDWTLNHCADMLIEIPDQLCCLCHVQHANPCGNALAEDVAQAEPYNSGL